MKKNRIAVVLPSRGLVFSETVEELLRELQDFDHQIFWSHGNPIPECFEEPTQEVLSDESFTHVLFVEEDMIIPSGMLRELLEADKHAIACDYPVTDNRQNSVKYVSPDTALYTGCGFLLVKWETLKELKAPIWRDDITWKIRGDRYVAKQTGARRYGKQDVTFGIRMYTRGTPIYVHTATLGQRKLVERGLPNTNNGSHTIEEWTEISPQKIHRDIEVDYELVKEWI